MRAFALLLIPLLLACSGVLDDPSTAGAGLRAIFEDASD